MGQKKPYLLKCYDDENPTSLFFFYACKWTFKAAIFHLQCTAFYKRISKNFAKEVKIIILIL